MRPARVLAGGLIVALAVVSLSMWSSNPGSTESNSPGSTLGPLTSRSAVRASASSATTTADSAGPLDVVRNGLSAWGRFAVTGDLRDLDPWFASDGPQYARFVEEATGLRVGGPAYAVDIHSTALEVRGSRAFVRGRVTFARNEGPARSYDWTFTLERNGGSWIIWTVESRAQATS